MQRLTREDELRYLEERLNPYHLHQRLGVEEHREAWVVGQGINLFHIENWYSIHSVIRGLLRVLGLRKRGQRNALDIQLDEQDIYIRRLSPAFDGYTVLLLSDLHLDINGDMPDALINAVRDLEYDVCVLTGDYRAKTWGSHLPTVDAFHRVRDHLSDPVYAVLGNHDSIRMVPHLEGMGIRVLINESVQLRQGDEVLWLAGIDDPHYFRSDNMELACDNIPREEPSILLSHSPEMYKHAAFANFDLMLCGHTHGGQVCLPGGVPIMVNANCPRRMIRGRWDFAGLQGYTSVGSGASVVDVRINCPPQVSLLRLHPASESEDEQK